MPPDLATRLLAQAGGDAGATLPTDLAKEICTVLDAVPKPLPEVPSMMGASARRLQESLGRAAGHALLYRANDTTASATAADTFLKTRGSPCPTTLARCSVVTPSARWPKPRSTLPAASASE